MNVDDHASEESKSVCSTRVADDNTCETNNIHAKEHDATSESLADERSANYTEGVRDEWEGVQEGETISIDCV